ncbi:hypothetical protein [Streptomyces sp. NBC_00162]|uniref:hypothetical protein n=1 Tax=Streptomyces sp. NBC_00162 TaxID=2903629 RepID=UPI00214C0085|nr:hypothetical protein [Streptomyces sp. NBC_00162]UUU45015.1 hypothetical protein JIW86_40410 [Streptomyces sp. NBC_00162]
MLTFGFHPRTFSMRRTEAYPPSLVKGLLNLLIRAVLVSVNGLGVEAEQHGDAVAGTAGDLGRGEAGLQPE